MAHGKEQAMTELKTRPRPTGATAVLGRTGFPHVTSATEGEIHVVTGPSQPGFNPLDLLYASLSACLTMSARVAASQMGVLERLREITAQVTGEKGERRSFACSDFQHYVLDQG